MKLILLLLTLNAYSAYYHTTKYDISFDAYLITDLKDYSHAIKRQINHTLGPMQKLKTPGKRASLGHDYSYKITKIENIKSDLYKVFYNWQGKLIAEENINIDSFKVIAPINAKDTFKKAQKFRGRCGSNGNLAFFFHSWSPFYKNCRLKEGKDYEKFHLNSFSKVQNDFIHLSKDFLVSDKYKLFYYFGSDFFSNKKFGYAQKAFNKILRKLKKQGFKNNYSPKEIKEIFSYNRTYSKYKKLAGTLNGHKAEVHIMLANPTESTPNTHFEFFKFIKYALENGSSIQYMGHAGLGAVFDLDYLEKKYKEKINYPLNQKQMIFLDGCNTYFYSDAFFSKKKKIDNTLVLITNAATITTDFYKQSVHVLFDLLLKEKFNNFDIINKTYYFMKRAKGLDYQMLNVTSN